MTDSHAPAGYICPFCLLAQGVVNEHVWSRESDVLYRDAQIMAFICAGQWPNNPGHALVIPVDHIENLYVLPDPLNARIQLLARRLSMAMKAAYGCSGISTRQHNEPEGGQDVWHYHLHVFPRWQEDRLYALHRTVMPPARRADQADSLRPALMQVLARDPMPPI